MDILEVKNLTKKYKKIKAVDNISFSLQENEILGLLGPNGAGKTTTIQMLLGTLTPTLGSISYFGKNFKNFREEILENVGFSSTYTKLPDRLTVKENLKFFSYFYSIKNRQKRIKKIISQFQLNDLINQKYGDLSEGQRTRVNLAKAFLNKPKILLLDEPTASLDPNIASDIRNYIIEERNNKNLSILITSHNMAEIEQLCDRVIFINYGKIIDDDTPANLAKTIKDAHVNFLISKNILNAVKVLRMMELNYYINNNKLRIDIDETKIAILLDKFAKNKVKYDEISIDKPNLEDYFIYQAKQ